MTPTRARVEGLWIGPGQLPPNDMIAYYASESARFAFVQCGGKRMLQRTTKDAEAI